ncbi:hypothetical protein N7481_005443 [Penicillium waksmanii]|uniref:uncharacterized protein n=1 Tax=Penicillium waksmanii TaxID=69791 RepID=UPI002547E1E5|nr:uncharacterized protein N7481_005443 [Penicillium waksmanii]KAJ5983344.1 hypothetical protein N7481_005443 [Penicillium waksmanii]
MSSLPQPKRRRLDEPSTLSKPFKPPLRKPIATGQPPKRAPQTPEVVPLASDEARFMSGSPESKTNPGSFLSSPFTSPANHLRRPIPRHSGLSTPTRSPLGDPEVLALQRQQSVLRGRLALLRSELDAANQALRIESSTQDSELAALIIKWRHVSQKAADEVFEGAQERVKRMGGMAAWREQSKRDTSRWDFENEDHEREHADEDEERPIYSEDTDETPGVYEQEEASQLSPIRSYGWEVIFGADAIGYRNSL